MTIIPARRVRHRRSVGFELTRFAVSTIGLALQAIYMHEGPCGVRGLMN